MIKQMAYCGVFGTRHIAQFVTLPIDPYSVFVIDVLWLSYQFKLCAHFECGPKGLALVVLKTGNG